MSIINTFTTLETVINEVRLGRLGVYDLEDNVREAGEHFDVYSSKGVRVNLHDQVYVGEEVIALDKLENGDFDYGTLPETIKGTDWSLLYSGEITESVISSVRMQLAEFDNLLILKAIDYYCEYDCFYDFKDLDFNAGQLET